MTEDHLFVDASGAHYRCRETMRSGWLAYYSMVPDYRIEVKSKKRGHETGAKPQKHSLESTFPACFQQLVSSVPQSYYQCGGGQKYAEVVRKVLKNLPKYRNYVWEPNPRLPLGSFDGYADSIESAIYLVNREPVPEASDWIDSEMKIMFEMQKPDGHIENWYGEGNFNRTALLYALMKSQGVRPAHWKSGLRLGAVRGGTRLYLNFAAPEPGVLLWDRARHRRVINLDKNYVRLNEFPEWYVVDENTLYRLHEAGAGSERVLLGSELIAGVTLRPGNWILEPLGPKS